MEEPTTKEAHEGNLHSLRYGIPINYRWLVEFVLLPLIIAGIMFWMTSIWARLNDFDLRLREIDSAVIANTTNGATILGSLIRIEAKLDESIKREIVNR